MTRTEQIVEYANSFKGKGMENDELKEIIRLAIIDGAKWADENPVQPSLPSNLDEAAEEAAKTWRKNPDGSESREIFFLPFIRGFKAGVEWLAGQGWKEVDSKNYPVPDKKKIYIVYTKEHYHLARVINHPKDDNLYQWKCTEFPNARYDMCEGDKYFEIRRK